MTIDEAIEIIGELLEDVAPEATTDGQNALKLGIEALKRVKGIRHYQEIHEVALLPGETKD